MAALRQVSCQIKWETLSTDKLGVTGAPNFPMSPFGCSARCRGASALPDSCRGFKAPRGSAAFRGRTPLCPDPCQTSAGATAVSRDLHGGGQDWTKRRRSSAEQRSESTNDGGYRTAVYTLRGCEGAPKSQPAERSAGSPRCLRQQVVASDASAAGVRIPTRCHFAGCHRRGERNPPAPLQKEEGKERGRGSRRREILTLTVRVTAAAFVKGQTISRCAQQSSSEPSGCPGRGSRRSAQWSHSLQWKRRLLEGLLGPRLCWHGHLHRTAENETCLTCSHEASDLVCVDHLQQHRLLMPSYKAFTSSSFSLRETAAARQETGASAESNPGARLWPENVRVYCGIVLNPGAREVKRAPLRCSISHSVGAAARCITNEVDELFLAHGVSGREKPHGR